MRLEKAHLALLCGLDFENFEVLGQIIRIFVVLALKSNARKLGC